MTLVQIKRGRGPIVLGQSHCGIFVPEDLWARLNLRRQGLDDTDRHITRHYDSLHAIQMKLALRSYMVETPPWYYAAGRADKLRPHLSTILNNLNNLACSGALLS